MSAAIKKLGKRILGGFEGFTGSSTPPILSGETPIFLTGLSALLLMLGNIVFVIMFSYGAARLSYCYNKYIGTDDGVTTLYVIICFLFSGFYYPYYSIYLNPLCIVNKGIRRR